MKDSPIITGIEITRFSYPVENVAVDETYSMPVFTPGAKTNPTATVIQIHTDQGITVISGSGRVPFMRATGISISSPDACVRVTNNSSSPGSSDHDHASCSISTDLGFIRSASHFPLRCYTCARGKHNSFSLPVLGC